ncbi:response regulator transcription factor [Halalkalibacter urbisdiaboli]|uniref:response regulator transcription factor n=1 Tax=Halalkalibacter urbisdiaboli TaxID=1960589 RepID=UPI000B43833F|nr:response regulator [Halalkalibacter urbisdiaboli]
MKAIIIDDEKHVREGLMLLAEWERFGIETIFEASDGEEAVALISQHQPEIIFTDMSMPRKDGIHLLKWIHASKIHCKTIVVSGYDDFQYMRNAIAFGSFDYILKPIQPDVLNETLSRAVKEWKEQASNHLSNIEKARVINEVKPLYWDYLLSGMLDKAKLTTRVIKQIKNEFQIDVSFLPVVIAVLPMNMMIKNKYQGDADLAFFSLLNISNEILTEQKSGVAFRNLNKEQEIVLLFWKTEAIADLAGKIAIEIHRFTKIHCTIVVGQSSMQISESYESAENALLKQNLLEHNWNTTIVIDIPKNSKPLIHPFEYSEEIKWAIQSGSTDQIDTILERVFQTFERNQYFSREQIAIWESQFEILKEHWLKEYQIESETPFYEGKAYWNDDGVFSFNKFKEEKRKEFHELIRIVYNVQFKKEKNSVQKIEEYIRHNYQKDIKLSEIADRFFLSREYISRKFKQEYDATITDYLTKIRIEKAKELLENPFLKIYEVADSVGYQNDKYFIKVFKKFAGMTPKEYQAKIKSGEK